MHQAGFVQDLAIVLGVAAITGLAFQLIKMPSVLGYLLAGLIVGPYLRVPLFADPERVQALSEFGVVLVMFSVGLEFRIEKFLRVLPISGITALIEIGLLFWAGYELGHYLGWSETRALFLGACICISSTMAVSKILEQRPIADDSRQLVLGVLVLQDVAAIALIAVMTAVAQGNNASFGEALGILGKLVAVLLAIIAAGMFIIPRYVRKLVATGSNEVLVVGAVGLCFSVALLAEQLGYSAALGAFIAGILVAESGLGRKVEHSTAGVRDVFAAVFFVSVGMTVDPRVAASHFDTSLLLLAVIVLAQFIAVTVGGLLTGSGLRRSITAGLTLGQIGEFAFIIAAIGAAAGVIKRELQPILVSVAVLSTFTTALSVRFADRIALFVENLLPARVLRLLALYESWVDSIRQKNNDKDSDIRRVILGLILDFSIMAALVLCWRAFEEPIAEFLHKTLGISFASKKTITTLALGIALLPPVVPLIVSSRKLARRLADRALDESDGPARQLFIAVVVLVVVAFVGIPLSLLLAPLVGSTYLWGALGLALAFGSLMAWKRAVAVDGEIESGGIMIMRAIAEQGMPEAERETAPAIRGYGKLREWVITEDSYALGRSLAQLQIRSITGASIVALKHHNASLRLPSPNEALNAGDTLVIAGCGADQDAAVLLLSEGTAPARTSIPPSQPQG